MNESGEHNAEVLPKRKRGRPKKPGKCPGCGQDFPTQMLLRYHECPAKTDSSHQDAVGGAG